MRAFPACANDHLAGPRSKLAGRRAPPPGPLLARLGRVAEVYEALVLGTADYISKNGFTDVLSDSRAGSTPLCRHDRHGRPRPCAGARGPHAVAVLLGWLARRCQPPSPANLGIDTSTVPIEAAHRVLLEMLAPVSRTGDAPAGLAGENLQARIRGVILMAISNERGWLVLTTGNKSEMAVGYATLYGDMAGGYAF